MNVLYFKISYNLVGNPSISSNINISINYKLYLGKRVHKNFNFLLSNSKFQLI